MTRNNINKFKSVIFYILDKLNINELNTTDLIKLIYILLYFIDFDFYEKYEHFLVGATYIKKYDYPFPVKLSRIFNILLISNTKHNIKLTNEEKEIIDNVLNKFKNMDVDKIKYYYLNDMPVITTKEGNVIEYEAVFYRTNKYSVKN